MGFVLHKGKRAFYQAFAEEIKRAVNETPSIRGTVRIAFSASQTPAEFAGIMDEMRSNVDALAATAVAHHQVTESVAELRASGVPCFSLLNDFAQGVRQGYIGLNNVKIGRIAASMIATAIHRPGKLAVFVGGYRRHGH